MTEAGVAPELRRVGRLPCLEALAARLSQPVDIAWLSAFRVLFGLTMFVSMLRFIAYGWIEAFFVAPRFHFKYWGFGWVEALSPFGMHALFWSLAALGLSIACGLYFRIAAFAFALGFSYLQLVDVTNYLNHYYLASLLAFLLALSPAHRAFSLDAWRSPALRRDQVARVWLSLLRLQVGVVYTFAGLAKAHGDWLLHAQPLRIWLAARTDMPLLGPLFAYEETAFVMSWAGFLFDSTIVLFLSWRRTRPFAYVAVIAFHVLTRMLFPIGMFPVIMVLGALVFFPPEWPRDLLARAARLRGVQPAVRPALGQAIALPRRGVLLFAAYCLLQLVMPLRFLAYRDGNVRWDEQGMRFSWRVMLREKNGSASFRVHSPARGQSFYVSPSRYLTPLQEREMVSQPDLILQFAHFLRDEYARRGYGEVEIYVESFASLNGRPNAPLIDPSQNLAAIADGLAKAHWIAPAPSEPPPSFERRRLFSWSKVP